MKTHWESYEIRSTNNRYRTSFWDRPLGMVIQLIALFVVAFIVASTFF